MCVTWASDKWQKSCSTVVTVYSLLQHCGDCVQLATALCWLCTACYSTVVTVCTACYSTVVTVCTSCYSTVVTVCTACYSSGDCVYSLLQHCGDCVYSLLQHCGDCVYSVLQHCGDCVYSLLQQWWLCVQLATALWWLCVQLATAVVTVCTACYSTAKHDSRLHKVFVDFILLCRSTDLINRLLLLLIDMWCVFWDFKSMWRHFVFTAYCLFNAVTTEDQSTNLEHGN
jgi:hypothetical protein